MYIYGCSIHYCDQTNWIQIQRGKLMEISIELWHHSYWYSIPWAFANLLFDCPVIPIQGKLGGWKGQGIVLQEDASGLGHLTCQSRTAYEIKHKIYKSPRVRELEIPFQKASSHVFFSAFRPQLLFFACFFPCFFFFTAVFWGVKCKVPPSPSVCWTFQSTAKHVNKKRIQVGLPPPLPSQDPVKLKKVWWLRWGGECYQATSTNKAWKMICNNWICYLYLYIYIYMHQNITGA